MAQPDQAQLSVGVQTQGGTAEEAAAENATQTARVLTVLKQALGSGGQVKTAGYSVSPQFQYPREGGPGKVVGYSASNTVDATIDNLSLVSKVIDAATQAGANNIGGISFTLKDESALKRQALAKAAEKARANAEAIARALQVQVLGVLQAEESGGAPTIRPMMAMRAASMVNAAETPATPVEAGQIEVRASVIVTLQVQ